MVSQFRHQCRIGQPQNLARKRRMTGGYEAGHSKVRDVNLCVVDGPVKGSVPGHTQPSERDTNPLGHDRAIGRADLTTSPMCLVRL